MPKASGFSCLRRATSVRSSLVRAWKMILVCLRRTANVASASGPLPKKMTFGKTVGELIWSMVNLRGRD